MNNRFLSINASKLIIGTANGTVKDARASVESLIQRHCDMPSKTFFAMKKNQNGGFHFEIQEDPEGGSVLSEITKHFSENPGQDLIIKDVSDYRQYQIFQRTDGTLRTFFLEEDEQVFPEVTSDFEELKGKPFVLKAYQSSLAATVAITGVLFLLSTVALMVSIFTWQAFKQVQNGYSEAIFSGPIQLMLDDTTNQHQFSSTPDHRLPMNKVTSLINRNERNGTLRKINSIEYKNGSWSISMESESPDSGQSGPDGSSFPDRSVKSEVNANE